jgi:nucleoside-diphosphate-sugar epimerase
MKLWRSNLFCEHLGENYRRNHGLGFADLRFSIVYGPGQSYRGFGSFKGIIEKPVAGLPAKVLEDGIRNTMVRT